MAKRKALGKGLSALIPDGTTFDEADGVFFQCPIEAIAPNPFQPRQSFQSDELREMADSIREKGIITPLLVSRAGGGYQLIAGERRWRAAQIAGLERVPVVVRDATPVESLELALIENIHRKDLNPIEEAIAYSKLIEDLGVTQQVLAKRLGKDRSTVTNLLRLLNSMKPGGMGCWALNILMLRKTSTILSFSMPSGKLRKAISGKRKTEVLPFWKKPSPRQRTGR